MMNFIRRAYAQSLLKKAFHWEAFAKGAMTFEEQNSMHTIAKSYRRRAGAILMRITPRQPK